MNYLNVQAISETIISARSGKMNLVDMKALIRNIFEKERVTSGIILRPFSFFSTTHGGEVVLMLRYLFSEILILNMGRTKPYSREIFQVFKEEVNLLQTYYENSGYFLVDVLRRFLDSNSQLRDLEMDDEHSNEVLLFVLSKGLLKLDHFNRTNLRIFNPTIVSFAKL